MRSSSAGETSEDEGTTGETPQPEGGCPPSPMVLTELDSVPGSEGAAGQQVEPTLTITARRKASMAPRTWAEAGTQEAEGGRREEGPLEEEVRNLITRAAWTPCCSGVYALELNSEPVFCPQVTMATGTGSRCTTAHLRPVGSGPRLCRGWTWLPCPPASVRGRTARERENTGSGNPLELMEVSTQLQSQQHTILAYSISFSFLFHPFLNFYSSIFD